MPEGQDPYGAFAYYQQIRKEMLSAINFRRSVRMGISLNHGNGGAPHGFVLSNPITHVDRVYTPLLRNRLERTQAAVQEKLHQQLPSKPPSAISTPTIPAAPPAKDATAATLPPIASSTALPTTLTKPPRATSAAVRPSLTPTAPAQFKHSDRVSSAGSRRSSDPEFVAKVAALEATLQQERETRLRVQNELARLESALASKLKDTSK